MLLVVFTYYCRIYEMQKYQNIYFLSALSINIHIVGGVELSEHNVTFLSLRITRPLDVYSDANTTTQSFSGKFLLIPLCTVQFVCCIDKTACASVSNDIKPANFVITFCIRKVGHVRISNTRGPLKGNLLSIHGQEFFFSVKSGFHMKLLLYHCMLEPLNEKSWSCQLQSTAANLVL